MREVYPPFCQLLVYLRVIIQTAMRHLRGGPLSIMERTQSMGKRGEAFARSREKWRMQVRLENSCSKT